MSSSRRVRAWQAAARAYGIDPAPLVRPTVLRWLSYALWRPLPERYRVWVLWDTTCGTWVLRHLLRAITLAVLPTAALAIFLPTSTGIRVTAALLAGGLAIMFSAMWTNESTEHRLIQAGWPWEFGTVLREERSNMMRG